VQLKNNTCVASSGVALEIGDQGANGDSEARYATYNTVLNNIVEADGAGALALRIEDSATATTHYVDYNCYWAKNGAGLANIGGTVCTTLAGIQAAWAVLGKPENDAHSIVVDPQLDGNYLPRNPAVISGGYPDANGTQTNIGGLLSRLVEKGRRARYR